MTPKQKLVVVVLAVADLLVIAGLGVYVWMQRRPVAVQQPPPLAAIASASDCAAFLLDSAALSGWDARVSETGSVLLYEVKVGGSAGPVADAQIIWRVLDSLSPDFARLCDAPETVAITAIVGASSSGPRQRVTAQFSGDALATWVQGLASDSDLASQASFRSSPAE